MHIKELSLLFGSYTKAQEIVFLLHDLKPVVRQGFYEEELPPIEQFCEDHQLVLVKSVFKVVLTENEIYSDKGLLLPLDNPQRGLLFAYISKDETKAWLAHYYELMQNHAELGKLLGYPPCCVGFFLHHPKRPIDHPQLRQSPRGIESGRS